MYVFEILLIVILSMLIAYTLFSLFRWTTRIEILENVEADTLYHLQRIASIVEKLNLLLDTNGDPKDIESIQEVLRRYIDEYRVECAPMV